MNTEILRSIFFRSSVQNGTIPAWPFLQPKAVGTFDSQALDNKMQELLHSDATWDFLRDVGSKHNVEVNLVGASAGRLAYRSALILRRESGEERISPFAIGTSFDDIVPLYSSLLSLSVGGADEDVKSFSKDIHAGLSGLVELELRPAASYNPDKRGGDPISKMVLPLSKPHAPNEVVIALQTGVLGGNLADEQDKTAGLHTLEILALFDLSPTPDLKAQLARVGRDVSSLEALQGADLIYINKLYKGLFLEASDKENFYKMLSDMQMPFSLKKFAIEYGYNGFLESIQTKKPLATLSDGVPHPCFGCFNSIFGQTATQSFADNVKFQLVNHVTVDYDSYRNMTLNPYGKINGYISRKGDKYERAVLGDGFYTLGSWKQYWGSWFKVRSDNYTVYAVQNPNLKSNTFHDRGINLALIKDAAEAYVVTTTLVDPKTYLEQLESLQVDRLFLNNERRQILALSFNKEYQDLRHRFLGETWGAAVRTHVSVYQETLPAEAANDAFSQAPRNSTVDSSDVLSETDQGAEGQEGSMSDAESGADAVGRDHSGAAVDDSVARPGESGVAKGR